MAKDFSGKGGKRPQVDIPLGLIDLDASNPRLPEEYQKGTQYDILSVLYRDFDLEEIAYSMIENGYFDEEPIVVVVNNLPKGFVWEQNVDKLQSIIAELIQSKKIRVTVVEGNRRIATAKLLVDSELRKKLKIDETFPKTASKEIYIDLTKIPAIVYKEHKDISPYLGVRHIAGILKWEAYAKARYIAKRVEEEKARYGTIEKSITEVQKKVGDRTDVIKRQYMFYKIIEQAEKEIDFDMNAVIQRFSLVGEAINSPSIRDYVGVHSYKDADFEKPFVPKSKLENLERLLIWIFGNGKEKAPILTDSRRIKSHLAPVLADKDATDYLMKTNSLEDAYERSGGDKQYLIKRINTAIRSVSNSLGVAYKYKEDKEIKELVKELIRAIEELQKMVLEND
jgi:hypothetical protein